MAREFAKRFYRSKAWKNCRDGYFKKRAGLCEICLAKGIYKPGEIVHHKIPLTPENISDPDVSLSWDNLELVCRDCHADLHKEKEDSRYCIDEVGNIISRYDA